MPPGPHPTHQSLFSLTSPAFDTVSHQILLSTLAELGIAVSALRGFTSYLTNGIFQVTWNGSLSKPCFLETGVPQGSVSGLLLLSLCTRSLGFASTFHGFSYHHYADDTQLFLSPPPILLQHLRCNAHLRMFGRHLCLDSCVSPQMQP